VRLIACGLATLSVAALLAACGGGGEEQAQTQAQSPLTVLAAASLTEVFPKIDPAPHYSFAGSDTLLAQIEQGAPADVFASANTKYPDQLFKEGKCEQPVVYATNRLVVVVPKSNPAGIKTVDDLTKPGVKVVIADEGVPVGDYTREVLDTLGLSDAVLANVVSQESDVKGVIAKVAAGQADAGFVYRTDVAPVADQVAVRPIDPRAQPPVQYAMCVLDASTNHAAAQQFQARVLGPVGRAQLTRALFGLPKQ
jgi:molybdate transport system substrate-binding protein